MLNREQHIKWLSRLAALSAAVLLGLFLFAGTASADVLSTSDTSLALLGYDSSPPLVTSVEASETGYEGTHTLEADFVDVGSDVEPDAESISVPDALVWGCQRDNRHIKCSASNMKSGDHSMHVSVKDKAGNWGNREGRFTVRDKVAPVIDSISASSKSVTVKYHDPSPSSGIASVVVTVDGVKLNCDWNSGGCDGDSDGYYHDSYDRHHKSDGYYHDDDGDDHEGSDSSGYTCPITFPLTCGSHQVLVTVTDKAGNSTTGTATIDGGDCEPPVTTDNAPAGWQNTDVSVTLSCTDTGSGCASTTYELDGGATVTGNTVSITTDGIHVITYRSVDAVGNVETTRSATVMIDTTPPELTLPGDFTVAATEGASAAAIFSAGATDLVDGTVPVNCSAASGDLFPLGSTTVDCSATDSNGNTATGSFVVTVCQSGRPAIDFICPLPGSPDIYWKDRAHYDARILTLRFSLVNGAGPDAYNVKVTGSTADNGVTAVTPIPIMVGNLASGASLGVEIDYHVPVNVGSFTVASTVCADDQCGTTYYYPEIP